MWDPPGPGLEPVSFALAVRFLTTAPPGKPSHVFFFLVDCKPHLGAGPFLILQDPPEMSAC